MTKKEKDNTAGRAPRMKKMELQEKILDFLQKEKRQAFNYKQVAFGVGATHPSNRNDVINLLDELAAAEMIIEVELGRYKANTSPAVENIGLFVRRSNGKNGVMIDDELIMVAERNSMHALNGDKVRVEISANRQGAEQEAKVIEIIEPKDQVFIGTLNVEKNYASLIPDSKFLAADII
ncbi:MAG: ribonuclease R, partial [Muribaculaceae bacterium]|nr:ribonuclease R [Muribaculaceae bacterium]